VSVAVGPTHTQATTHRADLYPDTPHEHLDWQGHRLPSIISEISELQPDVLCLQEVEQFDEIQEALAPHG
jgi:mRNA deadenylase 3'-5' endonuclease subunit Ccr4